nr:JAB domain-containing protein [uncultured Massilia sp.]
MNATALECRDSGAIANLMCRRQEEDAIISEALAILRRRTSRASYERANSPTEVRRLLMLTYGAAEKEHFGILWLDVKNRIIKREILFTGTLASCHVYPREVVKAGLTLNASGCILFHNHPSGMAEPSEADRLLTRNITQALGLVDMRVLDHIIVTGELAYSFAEHGEL